ncbi:hypothetical protein GWE18_00215 [Bradyrhizobium sp. CSA112]|uniref:hypothetical protein n=1 Tax=Bradyrhizobium sp. CSA112 TaxID=2699170 RepID=UPI0023B118B7|nr:hypothetical protein [Bradyrhizobium sp. CSA112]MDE5451300.1 hypothetical protein [Bradyrhizobium sp. CSA112]
MSNEQLADILKAQWNLLWPLNPVERWKRIEETRLDYEFEEQLKAVDFEMGAAQ